MTLLISEKDLEDLFIILDKAKMDIVNLAAQAGEGYYPPTLPPRDYFRDAQKIRKRIIDNDTVRKTD